MKTPVLSRLAPACGAVFAIGLFAANGSGNQAFSAPRAILGIAAITLVLPFIAYLGGLLRAAEGPDGWLATTALVAGVTGIVMKLGSGTPELALHASHVAAASPTGQAIEALGNGATLLCLYPLAIFCAATAVVAFRTRVLPRWLSAGAGVIAVALAVNGGFLTSQAVPALLLFVLWILLASVLMLVRSWRRPVAASYAAAAGGA